MTLYPLAILAGLLPLACIHITYVLAASHGQVPWCIPYIDSCTSISATGREPPAYFVFKAVMVPAAVVLMAYWLLNARWLQQLGCRSHGWLRALAVLGAIAGGGLIFYSVLLGAIGEDFRQWRHTGVLAFFGFTLFCQLIITRLLTHSPAVASGYRRTLGALKAVIAVDLLVGLASLAIGFAAPALYERINDAFAWNFTLLLCVHVLLTATLWQRTGFTLQLAVNRR